MKLNTVLNRRTTGHTLLRLDAFAPMAAHPTRTAHPVAALAARTRVPSGRALPWYAGLKAARLALAALFVGWLLALSACSAPPRMDDFAGQQPVLDLRTFFNGRVMAYGLFTDRSGAVVKRFSVTMDCQWTGDEGVLDEAFSYADGSSSRRVWRLHRQADGRYLGRADDVVGEATGQERGPAFQWRYTLRLPVDGSVYEVQFDDWMYLMSERVMLNRAVMSKFGFRLGEVTLSFVKPQAP